MLPSNTTATYYKGPKPAALQSCARLVSESSPFCNCAATRGATPSNGASTTADAAENVLKKPRIIATSDRIGGDQRTTCRRCSRVSVYTWCGTARLGLHSKPIHV